MSDGFAYTVSADVSKVTDILSDSLRGPLLLLVSSGEGEDEEAIDGLIYLAQRAASKGLAAVGADPQSHHIVINSAAHYAMVGSALMYLSEIIRARDPNLGWIEYLEGVARARNVRLPWM